VRKHLLLRGSRRLREFALVFLLVGAGSTARAQLAAAPAATPLQVPIKISAEARLEALTATDSPKLHWVLLSVPGEADVNIADARARALVVKAIDDAFHQTGCLHVVVENRRPCSFSFVLARKLSGTYRSLTMMNSPATAGQTPDSELRIQFTPPPPPAQIGQLAITITTDFVEKGSSPERRKKGRRAITILKNRFNWKDAAARVQSAAPPPEGSDILITVKYTNYDRMRPFGGFFDAAIIEDALLEVAVAALEKARAENLLPGAGAPTAEVMNAFQDSFRQRYALPVPGWPAPVVGFRFDDDHTDHFSIQVNGVRVASRVKVKVVRGKIAGASGMVDFVGGNPRIENDIQNALEKAAKDATAEVEPQLAAVGCWAPPSGALGAARCHVPTFDAVEGARSALRGQPLISGNVDVSRLFSELIFTGTRQWSVGTLNVKANLTGSITPEDFVTGQASLDASNLIRNILPVNVGETYNLAVQGGSEVQRATFDFSIPRAAGKNWIRSYGFTWSFLFARDAKQRYGNDNPGDPALINRQMGMTPQLFFELSRPPGSTWPFSTRGEVSFDWRAVLVAPRTSAPSLVDGQLSAPTAEWKLTAGHDSNNGFIGSTRLQLDATGRRGTHALQGDFAFQQYVAAARGEVFFGKRQRNSDFFLRYERGLGDSSTGTPLFQLERLGGPMSVRGLENGEYIGRNLSYDQSGAGVSVFAITTLFHRNTKGTDGKESADDKASGGGGFDLSNIYLVGLYDRGRVTNTGNLGDLLSVGPAAHSYGIAAELRKMPAQHGIANIAIGWARSPQSRLHTKGLLTLGVNIDF
jgi:hypothetical protein